MEIRQRSTDLKQIIEACGLIDLRFRGPKFTWNNMREADYNIQERVDRVMGNQQWVQKFPTPSLTHLSYLSWDHRPLILNTVTYKFKQIIESRGFRFDPHWLKDPKCSEIVEEAWTDICNASKPFQHKLNSCASSLKVWSTNIFGNIGKRIKDIQAQKERLYPMAYKLEISAQIKVLQAELYKLLAHEEIYWR